MALIAWAAAMPLVVYHFQQVNPYSVRGLAGFLLSPVVFVCSWRAWPKIRRSHRGDAGIGIGMVGDGGGPSKCSARGHAAAKFPGSDLPTRCPSWGWLVLWYAGLLALARVHDRFRNSRKGGTAEMAIGGGADGVAGDRERSLLTSPMTGMNAAPADGRPMRITLLAVGAGQCEVIESPDGQATLIDAGSTSTPQMMRRSARAVSAISGPPHVARLVLSNAALIARQRRESNRRLRHAGGVYQFRGELAASGTIGDMRSYFDYLDR